jgi:hypothetical protein
MGTRFGRRPAPRGQPEHIEVRHHAIQIETDPIANAHHMRSLHTLTIQMNAPTRHSLGR